MRAQRLLISDEVLLKLQEAFGSEVLGLAALRYQELQQQQRQLQQQQASEAEANAAATNSDDATSTAHIHTSSNASGGVNGSVTASSTLPLFPLIAVGRELPTFWLLRYGYKLSLENTIELMSLQQMLVHMDEVIDADKQLIQQKLLVACEAHRGVQEEVERGCEEVRVLKGRWRGAQKR